MTKHGVYRRWFTEADLKDFKSGSLRTITTIIRTGFELSVSRSRNAIYYSIIAIPKKSYFTILQYKTLCKTQQNTWIPLILLKSCLLDKRMVFSWLLSSRIQVSTQIMIRDYCIAKCSTFGGLFMALQAIFYWFKIFA